MAAPTPQSPPESFQEFDKEKDRLYLSLENYCWEDDPEFQSGLTQILQQTPNSDNPDTVRTLTRQAKCYFYARKIKQAISFQEYKQWLNREEKQGPRCRSPSCEVGPPIDPTPLPLDSTKDSCLDTPSVGDTPTTTDGNSVDTKAPYPTSFAQIVELITTGKPIPGIREIPNTLNEKPPTESVKPQRRKPWEVSQSSGEGSLPSPAATPGSDLAIDRL